MSRGRKPSTPSYRLYKRTGQAIVCIDGQTFYLGLHGTPESRREYDRLIAEWLANGRRLTAETAREATLSVLELVARFWQHALGYYRYKDGRPTTELDPLKRALDPLVALYGDTPVPEFGPLKLRAVRDRMIEAAGPEASSMAMSTGSNEHSGGASNGSLFPRKSFTPWKLWPAYGGGGARRGKPSRFGQSPRSSSTPSVRTWPGRLGRWSSCSCTPAPGLVRSSSCAAGTSI